MDFLFLNGSYTLKALHPQTHKVKKKKTFKNTVRSQKWDKKLTKLTKTEVKVISHDSDWNTPAASNIIPYKIKRLNIGPQDLSWSSPSWNFSPPQLLTPSFWLYLQPISSLLFKQVPPQECTPVSIYPGIHLRTPSLPLVADQLWD